MPACGWKFTERAATKGSSCLNSLPKKQALQQMIFWLIRLKNAEAIVGSCEFNRMDMATGTAVVGCALKKDYQKQGYMYEALCAVVEFGFARCGFAALYADIAKDNRPSLSLFLKMGFAPVEKDATRWLP
ncbi:MAG: GNAT family N-acetyltransferase, partial [Acidaminococcales bacterium]|nr:GNAT family N-acetyltransferase [Acidaminococcales bacterium]